MTNCSCLAVIPPRAELHNWPFLCRRLSREARKGWQGGLWDKGSRDLASIVWPGLWKDVEEGSYILR